MFNAMRLNAAQYKLEEAMMYHAARNGSMAFSEDCWKQFKMEYWCDLSSAELLEIFWNEIMVNMDTYQIVRDCSMLYRALAAIPKPTDLQIRPPKEYPGVTVVNRNLFVAMREDAERRDDYAINGPEGQQFKAMCLAAIAKAKQSQAYRDIHGEQGEQGEECHIDRCGAKVTNDLLISVQDLSETTVTSGRSLSRGSDNE